MLHFISWKVYGISLAVGLLFFYGYVGYRNRGLLGMLARRVMNVSGKGENEKKKEVAKEEGVVKNGEGSG